MGILCYTQEVYKGTLRGEHPKHEPEGLTRASQDICSLAESMGVVLEHDFYSHGLQCSADIWM